VPSKSHVSPGAETEDDEFLGVFVFFFRPSPYRYCTALATTPEHTRRVFRTYMSNVYKIFVLLNFHLVHFATLSDPCAGRTRAALTSTPNTSFVLLAPCTHAVYYLLISLGKVLGKNTRTTKTIHYKYTTTKAISIII